MGTCNNNLNIFINKCQRIQSDYEIKDYDRSALG